MKKDFSQNEINKIIKMYKDNVDIDDIIGEFKTEEHWIRKVLKEKEIDRSYNQFSNELYKRIEYLYSGLNYTYKEVGHALNISKKGVGKILKKRNITKRSYSENNQRYYRDKHYFDIIDTENKAYILGLIYADGCNCINHNAFTLSLQEKDVDVLIAIKEELQYEGPLRYNELSKKNVNYKNQYILNINDEYMSHALENLGVVNAKSLILEPPKFLDEELIPHFIRGYFDGDGCIYNNENVRRTEVQIVGTLEMCEWFLDYIHKIGSNGSIKHPKQSIDKNTYIVHISGTSSCKLFLSAIYKNSEIKMYRKYQKYLYMCENFNTRKKPIAA